MFLFQQDSKGGAIPKMQVLDEINISVELDDVKAKFRAGRTGDLDQISGLLEAGNKLIRPKAGYKISYIEDKLENAVIADGIKLTSGVLRKNLETVGRVFPYVVTIGPQLEEKATAGSDLLEQYYLEVIGDMALRKAREHLQDHLCSTFAMDGISFMSPGSLKDWPIQEQGPLFSMLGGVEDSVGVKLNESYLMIPRKSVSGIYFPTEVSFYSCQLCPRENCEGRKARYNENLAREYGVHE